MSRFMEVKHTIPNLAQKQITKELVYSNFTSKRYRTDEKYKTLKMPWGSKQLQKKSINPKKAHKALKEDFFRNRDSTCWNCFQ